MMEMDGAHVASMQARTIKRFGIIFIIRMHGHRSRTKNEALARGRGACVSMVSVAT